MRLSPTRWIAIAACTVAAAATQPLVTAQTITPATNEECAGGWESSDAAQSCGSASENPTGPGWVVYTSYYSSTAAGGQLCRVVVDCATEDHPDEEPVNNNVLVELGNFMNLYNCDGTLTHSDC